MAMEAGEPIGKTRSGKPSKVEMQIVETQIAA